MSVGPFSSVILSEHLYKSSTISDVLVVNASAMYCSPLSPVVLKLRSSFLNTLVVLNTSAMYEAPILEIKLLSIFMLR